MEFNGTFALNWAVYLRCLAAIILLPSLGSVYSLLLVQFGGCITVSQLKNNGHLLAICAFDHC